MQATYGRCEFSLDTLPVLVIDSVGCCNNKEALNCDEEEEHVHSAISLSSTRGCAKKLKKFPVLEEVCDNDKEMQEEIERSQLTHDCNLSALQLTEVPGNMPLCSLTKISLSENKLTTLPSAMFAAPCGQCIRELDVNSNSLTSLPDEMFYLPALEVLMLNHNNLTVLPLDNISRNRFLPSLRRVGIEFNNLTTFPSEFFELCPNLEEVLLGQNERMLDSPVPLSKLQSRHPDATGNVLVKIDNRPRIIDQIRAEDWATVLPWLTLDMHKIYPDKVLDYLYLGSLRTAQTVTVYHDLDIKFVLTVGRDLEALIEPGMRHLVQLINDFPGEDMSVLFDEAFEFINEARACKKGVLIHCFAGLSRSVTIAVAYLMRYEHLTRDQAMDLIKEARPAARPNVGFMETLAEYETVLRKEGILKL